LAGLLGGLLAGAQSAAYTLCQFATRLRGSWVIDFMRRAPEERMTIVPSP
jgi:hypothetical protein